MKDENDVRRKRALKVLATFIKALPLTFESTITLMLLRDKRQIGNHDYALLIREHGSEHFWEPDMIENLKAALSPYGQRFADKIKLDATKVRHQKKVWHCLYIDLMPDVKEKFNELIKG